MKIQEADAKSLLVAQGLPVPPGRSPTPPDEARAAAERFLAAGAEQVVDQGPGARRRPGQGRRRQARRLRRTRRSRSPRRSSAWTSRASPVRKVLVAPGRRHRQGVLPLGRARSGGPADPAHGLGRGRRRDRAGRRRNGPRRSSRSTPIRSLGLLDFQARELAFALGLGGAPQGRGRDRQGPRPDDARLRRRPRRDQPARDRPRDRRRRRRRSSGSSASTPRSRSTTPRCPATRSSRRCATPTRRTRPTARPARPA